MSLPKKFFEPSFRHRRLGTFLATIVSMMVFIATFVTASEAMLSSMTLAWNSNFSNRMTVAVPAVDDDKSPPQNERVQQALTILRDIPGIAHVEQVPDSDAANLLKPWIHDPALLKALPVPVLIDLVRQPGTKISAEDVYQKLKPVLHDAEVDDNASWLSDLAGVVHGVAAFGVMMILLSGLTLVLVVSLVCRMIMSTEKDTITLLHLMGAEDNDIARHFEQHARHLSLFSAFFGFLCAIMGLAVLAFFARHFADPVILQGTHWFMLIGVVLAVPLLAIGIASLSARLSVLNCLRTMP